MYRTGYIIKNFFPLVCRHRELHRFNHQTSGETYGAISIQHLVAEHIAVIDNNSTGGLYHKNIDPTQPPTYIFQPSVSQSIAIKNYVDFLQGNPSLDIDEFSTEFLLYFNNKLAPDFLEDMTFDDYSSLLFLFNKIGNNTCLENTNKLLLDSIIQELECGYEHKLLKLLH